MQTAATGCLGTGACGAAYAIDWLAMDWLAMDWLAMDWLPTMLVLTMPFMIICGAEYVRGVEYVMEGFGGVVVVSTSGACTGKPCIAAPEAMDWLPATLAVTMPFMGTSGAEYVCGAEYVMR